MTDGPVSAPLLTVAGRYDAIALIGRGGAAAVYRAWDRELHRWVALKVLPVDVDEFALDRRRSESRLLASMSHPGLVTLFDVVLEPDATCLVMELLEGGTLRDRIVAGPVPPDPLLGIAADVAAALAHIHARGIVHRDVKPANILLVGERRTSSERSVAKLSDFGIARLLESVPSGTTGVIGTARYLSPEQARGLPVGAPSDVYSLGLTLLEALTGVPAFPGTPAESFGARLVRDPVVPGSLGYRWRSLLTAMLARDVDARPTAEQVHRRLREAPAIAEDDLGGADLDRTITAPVLDAVPTGPTMVQPTAAAASPPVARTRRRRGAVLGGLGAAVLLGAGALLLPAALTGATLSPAPATTTQDGATPSATSSATPASSRTGSSRAPVGTVAQVDRPSSTTPSASAPSQRGTPASTEKSVPGSSANGSTGAAKKSSAGPKKASGGGKSRSKGSSSGNARGGKASTSKGGKPANR